MRDLDPPISPFFREAISQKAALGTGNECSLSSPPPFPRPKGGGESVSLKNLGPLHHPTRRPRNPTTFSEGKSLSVRIAEAPSVAVSRRSYSRTIRSNTTQFCGFSSRIFPGEMKDFLGRAVLGQRDESEQQSWRISTHKGCGGVRSQKGRGWEREEPGTEFQSRSLPCPFSASLETRIRQTLEKNTYESRSRK